MNDAPNPKWPTPPEIIDGEALLEWYRICGEIELLGMADKLPGFRAVMILYTLAWARYLDAFRHCQAEGENVVHPNGTIGQNAFAKTRDQAEKIVREFLKDMRCTPATHKPAPVTDQMELTF